MANIPTTLPKNIEALITIPDDAIDQLLTVLLERLVVVVDNHYTFIDVVRNNNSVSNAAGIITTLIRHKLIADTLAEEVPLPLICYYQYNKKKEVNPKLVDYLIFHLHQHPLFLSAVKNEKVPTESEPNLEDLIEFDDDDTEHMDENSYIATEQIIHNMMKTSY